VPHGKLAVAVIGLGMGRGHIRDYLQNPRAELVALCDQDTTRLATVAKEFGITTTFTDYHDLLTLEGLDAVSIALPNFLHAPITIDCLQAGKHVLCEKPLALNAREAEQMVATARANGLTLMVNFNYRFDPAAWFIHNAVKAGELGDIYFARTGWHRNRGIPGWGGWFTTKKLSGGGGLIDLGVHRLDLALWYMGYPNPVSVSGATYSVLGKALAARDGKTFDVDDLATGFIRFENGATLVVEASWASNSEKREEMFTTLYGTRGGASLRNVGEGYEFESRLFVELGGSLSEVRPKTAVTGLENVRSHFVRSVLDGTEPISPGEQGLVLMRVLDALYASAERGHEVRL
jgi:predicted dehydrogenase